MRGVSAGLFVRRKIRVDRFHTSQRDTHQRHDCRDDRLHLVDVVRNRKTEPEATRKNRGRRHGCATLRTGDFDYYLGTLGRDDRGYSFYTGGVHTPTITE